ncbi:MAG: aminotransferase class I/II-fold pyridoxal phosphate-dependent enzyme, partial [Planctomycetota bacterium]
MFNTIPLAPPDAILGLSEAFARDDDADKINLSVGVYKDENGKTPVLRCVKAAEQRLLEREDTKSYLGIDGLPDYRDATGQMLFGDTVESERYAVL